MGGISRESKNYRMSVTFRTSSREDSTDGAFDFVRCVFLTQEIEYSIEVTSVRKETSAGSLERGVKRVHHSLGQLRKTRQPSWHRNTRTTEKHDVTAISLLKETVRNTRSLGDKTHV